jgi:hypothetical protein
MFANTFRHVTTTASAKALAKAIDNGIAKITAKAWAKELHAQRCLQKHSIIPQPKLVPKPLPKPLTTPLPKSLRQRTECTLIFANTCQYLTTEAIAKALAKAIDKVTAKSWAKEPNAQTCVQKHFNI